MKCFKKAHSVTMIISILSVLLGSATLFCILFATAVTPEEVSFTVSENREAGLDGDIKVLFTESDGDYSGTLYLPGSAHTGELKLSWQGAASVTIGGKSYSSGSAPVPANGQSITYRVILGMRRASFTVRTLQGSQGVQGMFLNIDEALRTISSMNTDPAHKTSCYGSVTIKNVTHDMSIKGRGNWTWGSIIDGEVTDLRNKRPYNITIYKKPDSDSNMFKQKDSVSLIEDVFSYKWTLLANYTDGTLLRNKIGNDLAKQLGIGVNSSFVDVWMNGEYIGNYLLTPKYDYNISSGGYLLELDNYRDAEDPVFSLNGLEPAGSFTNLFTLKKYGADVKKAGVTTDDIQSWMQAMLDAVMDDSSEGYKKYIDVDSFAKLYLLQEFSKNYDVLCGSMFMYRNGLAESDKLTAGPVWDLDNAFGRNLANDEINLSSDSQFSPEGWYIDSISGVTSFLQYLGRHDGFMQRVYEIYNEFKPSFDGIIDNLDTQAAIIADSAAMNYSLYDLNQQQYTSTFIGCESVLGTGKYAYTQLATETYQDYLSNLKNFVSSRLMFFSDQLSVSAPAGKITGETEYTAGDLIILTADCSADCYQWQSSRDDVHWVNIDDATESTYSAISRCNMDGLYLRCIVKNTGSVINTTRVAKAAPQAVTTLDSVSLTVMPDQATLEQ